MSGWGGRLVLLAALAAVGILAWLYFFPSPERAIRKRLDDVAKTCSVPANEGTMAKLQNCQKLASFCADDIEVAIDAYGQRATCNGRNEVFQTLMLVRSQMSGSAKIEFLDPVITVLPDKETALVNLTIKGRIPNERDIMVQECKFTLKKSGRSWLIKKVETVKTLSKAGPRAVLGSQQVRIDANRRLGSTASVHAEVLRAEDGSRSVRFLLSPQKRA